MPHGLERLSPPAQAVSDSVVVFAAQHASSLLGHTRSCHLCFGVLPMRPHETDAMKFSPHLQEFHTLPSEGFGGGCYLGFLMLGFEHRVCI